MSEIKEYLNDELNLSLADSFESLMQLLMQYYSEKRSFKIFKKWYDEVEYHELIDYWCKLIDPVIKKLSSLMKENGTAICFERYYYNIALAALLKAFAQNGFALDLDQVNVAKYANEPGLVSYIMKKNLETETDFMKQYDILKTKFGERGLLH